MSLTAAIMQPYFFPYIGYFQLMQAVDVFVIYDDVQYMKGGWINRNQIVSSRSAVWLTLPVQRDSVALDINQRHYALANGRPVQDLLKRIRGSYSTYPAFGDVFPFIESLLAFDQSNVADYNTYALTRMAERLDIRCRFLRSSTLGRSGDEKAEARVLRLCQRLEVERYINPIGGLTLYSPNAFEQAYMRLAFLRTTAAPCELAEGPAHLSIIDSLMRKGFAGVRERLHDYELLPGQQELTA